MKRLFFILFTCFLMMTNISTGQEVRNITSEVKDGMVTIHYSISGKFYQIFNISIYVSRDGGNNFIGPLKEVTGDIGQNIKRGSKTVTWDIIKEMPMVEETLIFDVRAEITGNKPKSSFFIQYVANPTTYIGLRAGTLGIVGFYGEFRGNLNSFKSAKYTYKGGQVDYNESGYYIFSDQKYHAAFSALAGISYQPARNFFLYLGAGYGKDDFLIGFDTYNYEGDVKTGSEYAKYDGYCNSGVEVDLGIMFKIKKIVLSAGGTMLNFNTFGWTAGIGISL